jgi:hypothetical protein
MTTGRGRKEVQEIQKSLEAGWKLEKKELSLLA